MGRPITRQEQALLHLMNYVNVPVTELTMPFAMTQDGIGAAIGVSRSHASTVMSILVKKGYVSWIDANINGCRCKRRSYYLLPPGLEKARKTAELVVEAMIDIESVVTPLGRGNNTYNVVKAQHEIRMAKNAIDSLRDDGDLRKAASAIEHASKAIGFLSKEVV